MPRVQLGPICLWEKFACVNRIGAARSKPSVRFQSNPWRIPGSHVVNRLDVFLVESERDMSTGRVVCVCRVNNGKAGIEQRRFGVVALKCR